MNDHTTWLSILLPVYNVELYLAECLDSILEQIGGDDGIEIIIVDDASTDESRSVARQFCDHFPQQVRLVCHNQNEGVSAARNRLLDEARGEFIWFIDPDDYILDGAMSELRAIIINHNPDLILCDYRKNRFWKRKSFFGPTKQLSTDMAKLIRGVFKSRKMYCCVKVSRKSMWGDDLRFPKGRVFEDIATTPWLLLRTGSFYYMPSAWVHYRQRPGSIMDSVKRQTDHFDESKHYDLAHALIGYKDELEKCFKQRNSAVEYYVADFCAKEFTKTTFRMMRSGQYNKFREQKTGTCHTLFVTLEKCLPISFEKLSIEYIKRFRFLRYLNLIYSLQNIKFIIKINS